MNPCYSCGRNDVETDMVGSDLYLCRLCQNGKGEQAAKEEWEYQDSIEEN